MSHWHPNSPNYRGGDPDPVEDALKAAYAKLKAISLEFYDTTGEESTGIEEGLTALREEIVRHLGRNSSAAQNFLKTA